jgi:nitroreductase
MEFQEVVRRRRMVRTFTAEPVPQAALDRILGNALRGPSAGFSQGQAVAPFRSEFGVPDDQEPIGAIAIGYDAETEKRDLRPRRRNLDDLVHYGRWQG